MSSADVAPCARTISNATYTWLHDTGGAEGVPGQEVFDKAAMPPELLGKRNAAGQFREVPDGFQGDPTLVASDIFDNDGTLGGFMEEIAVSVWSHSSYRR
ncbi:hypothetical protein [Sphingomonas sp. ERG5]|uniref:hypothetical protein n=1 Tax=Sphingomonas sp. ERG5 TaxID=1381597 RepID=UPI00126A2181|nr:hypothetical protein [Sphingomonas sp. ERG5]